MTGLCACGCGGTTSRWKVNQFTLGRVKGEHATYLKGHHARKSPVDFIEEDRGWVTRCWIWQRSMYPNGYAKSTTRRLDGRQGSEHRRRWEEINGPVPDGLVLDHLCQQPACVNPDHLEAVTQSVNVLRGVPNRYGAAT